MSKIWSHKSVVTAGVLDICLGLLNKCLTGGGGGGGGSSEGRGM